MSNGPDISVLVGAYCHEDYVEQALDSVAAQSFKNFEVIITDDCSTDRTAELIHAWLERTSYPAVFIENRENRGICAVRNRALESATGEFVCSLSGDDWYEPDRLERQFEFFSGVPDDVGFIYGDVNMCDQSGSVLDQTYMERSLGAGFDAPAGDVFLQLLRTGSFLPAPGVMMRRSAVEAVGGYDPTLFVEDYYMWLQLAYRFRVRYLPGIVATWRVLPTSMSHSVESREEMMRSELRILSDWRGIDPSYDDAIAERVTERVRKRTRRRRREIAAQTGAFDRVAARTNLRELERESPSRLWRVLEEALAVPGFHWILRQALRVRAVLSRISVLGSGDAR